MITSMVAFIILNSTRLKFMGIGNTKNIYVHSGANKM